MNKPVSDSESHDKDIKILAQEYGKKHQTDVIFYNAEISDQGFTKLASIVLDCNSKAKKVLLILVTLGGNADSAYRIARFLQNRYELFTVCVPGKCKSAGTILAIGAHNILTTPNAELGPLDVQVLKRDEMLEISSGTTVISALDTLDRRKFKMFAQVMLQIKSAGAPSISLQTAMNVAVSITKDLYKELYQQIDPYYLGEMDRNLRIAFEYGQRLAQIGGNITEQEIERLVCDYPSHEFVIDHHEAKDLFKNVEEVDADLLKILAMLGNRLINISLLDIDLLSNDANSQTSRLDDKISEQNPKRD